MKGERTLRRLLIIEPSAVVRWTARKVGSIKSYLMLARKTRNTRFAQKMARIVRALLTKRRIYGAPITAA
jgi:hypothetical protein